jgi:hypothetical protein
MEFTVPIGTPEFFIDGGRFECAGTGLVRFYGIVHRHGQAEPIYSSVVSAEALFRIARDCLIAAQSSLTAASQKDRLEAQSH